MGLFGNAFKKRAEKLQSAAIRADKRDFMEGAVTGVVYIMAADGTISDEEIGTAERVLGANESLKAFTSEIPSYIGKIMDLAKSSPRQFKIKAQKELSEINGNAEEKSNVFAIILDVADAGGIDEKELPRVKEIAGWLGVRPADFGL